MDGLPQLQVRGFFQDSRGILWAGTKNGAAYFDGEEFVALQEMTKELGPSVNRFAEDSNGVIWMGCTLGLASYDGRDMKCFPFPEGMRGVNDMVFDSEDVLWFTSQRNLYSFKEGTFQLESEAVGGVKDSLGQLAYDHRTNRYLLGGLTGKLYEFFPEQRSLQTLLDFGSVRYVSAEANWGTELLVVVGHHDRPVDYFEYSLGEEPNLILQIDHTKKKVINTYAPKGRSLHKGRSFSYGTRITR
jgi:hypothetical protein